MNSKFRLLTLLLLCMWLGACNRGDRPTDIANASPTPTPTLTGTPTPSVSPPISVSPTPPQTPAPAGKSATPKPDTSPPTSPPPKEQKGKEIKPANATGEKSNTGAQNAGQKELKKDSKPGQPKTSQQVRRARPSTAANAKPPLTRKKTVTLTDYVRPDTPPKLIPPVSSTSERYTPPNPPRESDYAQTITRGGSGTIALENRNVFIRTNGRNPIVRPQCEIVMYPRKLELITRQQNVDTGKRTPDGKVITVVGETKTTIDYRGNRIEQTGVKSLSPFFQNQYLENVDGSDMFYNTCRPYVLELEGMRSDIRDIILRLRPVYSNNGH